MEAITPTATALRQVDSSLLWFLNARGQAQYPRQEIPSGLDWNELLCRCIQFDVAPLLYSSLDRPDTKAKVPQDVLGMLYQPYADNAVRNMRLYVELHRILAALQQEQIEVIVLKGAHLALAIYGNIALRSMRDIDILIKRQDLQKAERKLSDLGYIYNPAAEDRSWYLSNHFHFDYVALDGSVSTEVHWDVVEPGSNIHVDLQGLWERSKPLMISGVQARVLAPEDLILYLCFHTSRQNRIHPLGRNIFRSLYDIFLVCRHYREHVDWQVLRQRAQRWGVENSVYLILSLSQRLFTTAIPDQILETLKPEECDLGYVEWALQSIFNAEVDPLDDVYMGDNFERFWTSSRLNDRIKSAINVLFPSRREIAQRYQLPQRSKMIFLYYAVRWGELLGKGASRNWKMLRRDPEIVKWAERQQIEKALSSWLNPPSA